MLELVLQRLHFTHNSTCGELTCDDLRLFTLELPVKDGLPGSAIPPGRYKVELAASPKFLKSAEHDPWVEVYAGQIPHIQGIPNRSHILIHWGNVPHDTDGCILVGLHHDLDQIGESRKAFEQLFDLIGEPARAGGCWISVQGGIPISQPVELNLQGDL